MRSWWAVGFGIAAGCGTERPPVAADACALAALPADGPLAAEAAAADGPVALAQVRVREARITGDPGFDTLADLALDCALARDPHDPEARRWKGYVELQFHRFAAAEARMVVLAEETGAWRDALLLGDARMERGDLAGAAAAYDRAAEDAAGLEIYDRLSHLAWLEGDVPQAFTLAERALAAATPADPDAFAWAASRLGALQLVTGATPNALGLALSAVPDHRASHLLLGRYFLSIGDPAAAEPHLRAAGPTVEAVRALAEVDPGTRSVPIDPAGQAGPGVLGGRRRGRGRGRGGATGEDSPRGRDRVSRHEL